MAEANATVSIEWVDAATARSWLEQRMEHQRNISQQRVENMVKDMKAGRWKIGCDAITLLGGKLANGQHRLSALIAYGKSLRFLILRSKDPNLFEVIDGGKTRTVGDVMTGHGLKYANIISSAARYIVAYHATGENARALFERGVSRGEIIGYIKTNGDRLITETEVICSLYSRDPVMAPSLGVALIHLASEVNEQAARAFISEVYLGGQVDSSPGVQLHSRFARERRMVAKTPQPFKLALLIKGYNAYVSGSDLRVLKMGETEAFPRIGDANGKPS